MPHIHTLPNQHDMTVSAYIVLHEDDVWKCMVHWHRKIEKLMQIGGHIELNETPWQSMAHELVEESGYTLDELDILQPTADRPQEFGNIAHPVPLTMNTHNAGNDHYHSDTCYGFVAQSRPTTSTADGESDDIRWLMIDELQALATKGEALQDVVHIYEFLLENVDRFSHVPAANFSLEKPANRGIMYKRGAPQE